MSAGRNGVERAELHRTIWRIATDLRGSVDGWDFKSYVLGMRALELGGLAVAHHELRRIASPVLAELHQRTGAVASLAVLDRRDVVFVERHGRGLSSDSITRVGGRAPAHATAVGKAMLAWVDDRTLGHLYGDRLASRTPRTISGLDQLRTAPRGYAADHPRIDLLRHKGLVMSRSWTVGAWLGTKKAKDRVVTALEAGRPLREWIDRHVS